MQQIFNLNLLKWTKWQSWGVQQNFNSNLSKQGSRSAWLRPQSMIWDECKIYRILVHWCISQKKHVFKIWLTTISLQSKFLGSQREKMGTQNEKKRKIVWAGENIKIDQKQSVQFFIRAHFCKNPGGIRVDFQQKSGQNPGKTHSINPIWCGGLET